MEKDVENYLLGKNVYFDTAYVLDKMPNYLMVKMIRQHGADKILFGTDTPWAGQKAFVNHFKQLPLTEWEQKLILTENANKLLKDCM